MIQPYVDGNDICYLARCTFFGGANDPEDDGSTASGISTKLNPDILGCALPIPTCDATKDSPLPILPYLSTFVEVTGTKSVYVPLLDVGPATSTGNGCDLTWEAFILAGGNVGVGSMQVMVRILGARHLLKLPSIQA